jgi:hypothetical protein
MTRINVAQHAVQSHASIQDAEPYGKIARFNPRTLTSKSRKDRQPTSSPLTRVHDAVPGGIAAFIGLSLEQKLPLYRQYLWTADEKDLLKEPFRFGCNEKGIDGQTRVVQCAAFKSGHGIIIQTEDDIRAGLISGYHLSMGGDTFNGRHVAALSPREAKNLDGLLYVALLGLSQASYK